MVTPQSHRVHHSLEPQHGDRNFGVIFTIWDRMFGTLYANYDEYPDTGVLDDRFPLEQGLKGLAPVGAFAAQLWFPFRLILDRLAPATK